MIKPEHITGAILAGGASRRMGQDKALLKFGDKTFIQRIADATREVLAHVVIIADRAERYSFLHLPVHQDIHKNCGPLAGIHSALTHTTTSHTFIISCDLPCVTPAMIRQLFSAASENCITLVTDGIRTQPLFAVYPRSEFEALETALESGQRSVLGYLENRRTERLDFSGYAPKLHNVNLPEDLNHLG